MNRSAEVFALPNGRIAAESDVKTDVLAASQLMALRQIPRWLSETIRRLDALIFLGPNWDSYGAVSIDDQSVRYAKEFITIWSQVVGVSQPTVGASPQGFAALSWDSGSSTLDLEVRPNGTIKFVFLDQTRPGKDCERVTWRPEELLEFLTSWN